jgi:osmotically-inducible protein OsmY
MGLTQKVGAPAVFAVSVVLAACSTAPAKSPEQERADAATAERIVAALDANPIYYFRDVEVEVDNGVPGVTRVRNEMELERQGNRGGGDGAGSN